MSSRMTYTLTLGSFRRRLRSETTAQEPLDQAHTDHVLRICIVIFLVLGISRPRKAGLRSHNQKTQGIAGLVAGILSSLWLRSDIYSSSYQAPPPNAFGLARLEHTLLTYSKQQQWLSSIQATHLYRMIQTISSIQATHLYRMLQTVSSSTDAQNEGIDIWFAGVPH